MAKSRKVKKVYICPTCKGNGYVKIQNIYDVELQVHQCWDCDSEGEFYEYLEEPERVLNWKILDVEKDEPHATNAKR